MRRFALEVLAVIVVASLALARPAGEYNLALRTNGEPTALGVLTSTGASVTNATTAAPFTVTGGLVLRIQCDATAFVAAGGTSSATYTSTGLGQRIALGERVTMVLRDSTTTISMISATGTANCVVHSMM